jgi:two-component system KDP operon response regulator KdpE
MRILLIDDDENTVKFIKFAFSVGWQDAELLVAYQGEKGIELIKNNALDLVLLDLGLPDISGFEVVKRVRAFSKIPIIVLSVMCNELDKVQALELGADDYVAKPFGQMEILSRVKAFMRRIYYSDKTSNIINIGAWSYNFQESSIYNSNSQIYLTPIENKILNLLLVNQGQIVTYNTIINYVWKLDNGVSKETIRTHINLLRDKIKKGTNYSNFIFSATSIGYYVSLPPKTVEL